MKREKNNKIILDKRVTLILSVIVLVIGMVVFWELLYKLAAKIRIKTNYQPKIVEKGNTSIPYYDIFEDKKVYDIYTINYNEGSFMIIGYNNKMYYASSVSMEEVFDCVYRFTMNDNGKITNGIYECVSEDEDTYGASIVELDIDSNNIEKVIVYSFPLSTDAQYSIYFIHNDGVVDYYHADGARGSLSKNVFGDYKIMNISQKCIKSGDAGCKKTELTLTLKDGSTRKITNFNFE